MKNVFVVISNGKYPEDGYAINGVFESLGIASQVATGLNKVEDDGYLDGYVAGITEIELGKFPRCVVAYYNADGTKISEEG